MYIKRVREEGRQRNKDKEANRDKTKMREAGKADRQAQRRTLFKQKKKKQIPP